MVISYIKNSEVVLNTLRDVHRPKDPVGKATLFKHLMDMRMGKDDSIKYNFSSSRRQSAS